MSDVLYTVSIMPEARQLLVEAAEWYHHKSGEQAIADRWLTGFILGIEKLATGIEGSSPVFETDRLDSTIRQITYGSGRKKTHRAIFRVCGNQIEVVTIRHLSQNRLTNEDLFQ